MKKIQGKLNMHFWGTVWGANLRDNLGFKIGERGHVQICGHSTGLTSCTYGIS